MEHHLTATECHLPYVITQCYLSPDTSERTPPSPQPVLDLPTSEGWKAELTLVTCYIPRWFTRPQTVTHPSTNRAQCRLTSLIKSTPLTTTLCRHPNSTMLYSSTALKVGGSMHIWTPTLPKSEGVRTPGPPQRITTTDNNWKCLWKSRPNYKNSYEKLRIRYVARQTCDKLRCHKITFL